MYVDDKAVLADWVTLTGTSVTSNAYDLGESTNLGMFDSSITIQTDGAAAGPTDVTVTVQGSDDGTTWTDLMSQTMPLADLNKGIHTIKVPLKRARYLRVTVADPAAVTAFSAGKLFAKLGSFGAPVRDLYSY